MFLNYFYFIFLLLFGDESFEALCCVRKICIEKLVGCQDDKLFVFIGKTNRMKVAQMFLDEPRTKKTWSAIIQNRRLGEACNKNPIGLICGLCLEQCHDGIHLCMFHICLGHVLIRIPRVNIHGNNLFLVINNT